MDLEIKNFVTYSLRYQILLARHVSSICNTRIYVFDNNGFFDHPNDIKSEIIDGVRTVIKDNKRAVLSVAVKESFGSNEKLFLQFVDENVVEKDDIGLYVEVEQPKENVADEEQSQENVADVDVGEEQSQKNPKDDVMIDLKDISDAVTKLESIL